MLEPESRNFFFVRAENVIAVLCHDLMVLNCYRITTPIFLDPRVSDRAGNIVRYR